MLKGGDTIYLLYIPQVKSGRTNDLDHLLFAEQWNR